MGNRRNEAQLTDQQSTGVLNGHSNRCVCLTHISLGQGNCESDSQTLTVCSFPGWQMACLGVAWQQVMKTFRVTVEERCTCSISLSPS